MIITFDIHLETNHKFENASINIEIELQALIMYVAKQVRFIKEDMETEKIERGAALIICLLPETDTQRRPLLKYTGYTEVLANKITNCFSDRNFEWIFNKISAINNWADRVVINRL